MTFMPSPGSVVRLTDGTVGIVTAPDRVWTGAEERQVDASQDIADLISDSDEYLNGRTPI